MKAAEQAALAATRLYSSSVDDSIDSMEFDEARFQHDVMQSRLQQLEQENRQLRHTNELLRHAAAYFARPAPGAG